MTQPTPPHAQEIARRVAKTCLLMRTRRLSRILTRDYIDHIGAEDGTLDLSIAQFTLLAAIESSPGLRAADLVEHLDLEKSTVSRELQSMVRDGWITTARGHGRAQLLYATAAGRARFLEAIPRWEAAQRQALDELGPLAEHLLAHFAAEEPST